MQESGLVDARQNAWRFKRQRANRGCNHSEWLTFKLQRQDGHSCG